MHIVQITARQGPTAAFDTNSRTGIKKLEVAAPTSRPGAPPSIPRLISPHLDRYARKKYIILNLRGRALATAGSGAAAAGLRRASSWRAGRARGGVIKVGIGITQAGSQEANAQAWTLPFLHLRPGANRHG